jgi:hypothetical protein
MAVAQESAQRNETQTATSQKWSFHFGIPLIVQQDHDLGHVGQKNSNLSYTILRAKGY